MTEPSDPQPRPAEGADPVQPGHDEVAEEWYDDLPREPYTLRRFLRELAIAVAILALGLPVVLLATRGEGTQEQLSQEAQVTAPVAPPTPSSASSSPPPSSSPAPSSSPSPAADVGVAETRPVLFLAGPSMAQDAGRVVALIGHGGQALTGPGAGFAAGMPSLTSMLAQGDFDPQHDAVVVQGGEADADLSEEKLDLAAQQLADRIRLKFSPSTAVVFIGPLPGALPRADLLRVRDVLARAAAEKDVHFIDPVAEGWLLSDADLASKVVPVVGRYLDGAG